jgi:hypothetical protein
VIPLRRIARSPKSRAHAQLNNLARLLIVELRDKSTSQLCGKTAEQSQIHWAHVVNRGAKSIQWREWASLALCAGCHIYFDGDNRKVAREEWWAVKWPARAILLRAWRASKPPKIDLEMERMYLEQAIANAEAERRIDLGAGDA